MYVLWSWADKTLTVSVETEKAESFFSDFQLQLFGESSYLILCYFPKKYGLY